MPARRCLPLRCLPAAAAAGFLLLAGCGSPSAPGPDGSSTAGSSAAGSSAAGSSAGSPSAGALPAEAGSAAEGAGAKGALPPVPPPALPDPALMPAESDAVAPNWLPRPMALAGGAQLVAEGGTIEVLNGEERFRVAIGTLISPPVRSEDGTRVALSATVGDGPAAALLLIDRGPDGWTSRTLIKGLHWVDRLALGPTAQHLAFAWAGDQGGVAGLYWMELPNGAPQRLTNRAPYTPGQPPADFIPLPLGGAPVFDGPLLRWRSAEGEHQVELPQ